MWRLRAARSRSAVAAVVAGALIALATMVVAGPARAQQTQAQGAAAPASQTDPHPLARWIDAQAITIAGRYNFIRTAEDLTRQNRVQTQVQIRGRFTFDEAGRYSVHAGVFTGGAFDSGWNPTGIGTGEGTAKMYLKQLFLAAEPWQGVELRYGSMAPERGQSTEITTYDNDA